VKILSNHTFCISTQIKSYFNKNSTLLPITFDSSLLALERTTFNVIPNILYSGTFAEKDNIINIFVVLKRLYEKGLQFHFSLSGNISEELLSVYLKKLKSFNLEKRVSFLGFLSFS